MAACSPSPAACPRQRPPCWPRSLAARHSGFQTPLYFALAALLVVSFVLKKSVAGRRFEAIGANPLATRAVGLRVQRHQIAAYVYAQLLYCLAGVLVAGITREPTAFQGDSLLLAFCRRRRSRRNVAAWWSRLSDLDCHRRVLPEPTEPIRTRSWRAVFGSDHHPSFGFGFWYRRLLHPVDGKHDEATQTNLKGEEKNEVSR